MARGVTTQWEDIQVKMGNWKAVDKGPTSEDLFQENVQTTEHYDQKLVCNEKQLEEMAEDDLDFDEDDFMKEFREKRLAELKADSMKPSYGYVRQVDK